MVAKPLNLTVTYIISTFRSAYFAYLSHSQFLVPTPLSYRLNFEEKKKEYAEDKSNRQLYPAP